MARTLNRLTAIRITRLKKKGMYADGGGLYLRVADGGSKQWIFRYATHGRLRDMGIGPVHTLSLAEARERATEARKLRLDGIDPIAHKRARRAAVLAADAKAMTFKQCADAFIASHEAGWSNAKHRHQWHISLTQYVYPIIGSLPVSAIDTALVMKVIEPMWKAVPETASRVRGRIENVLDWAKVSGFRDGENPARWRGHLDHLLPAKSKVQKVEHHAALPYADIGAFTAKLRESAGVPARALELLLLTAARVGEIRGGTWAEIDLASRMWIIPAERMKGGKEHRIPLSVAAVAVLRGMHAIRRSDYVFPGRRTGRPLSNTMILNIAKQVAGRDITLHGFRSTFRDWAAERTSFPREVAEMALAHAIPDAVEAAYRRGDLFEKRRKLMDAWADYCGKPAASGGKSVAIREPRA
jgi:integrase